jgi:hypothetical protein
MVLVVTAGMPRSLPRDVTVIQQLAGMTPSVDRRSPVARGHVSFVGGGKPVVERKSCAPSGSRPSGAKGDAARLPEQLIAARFAQPRDVTRSGARSRAIAAARSNPWAGGGIRLA